MQGRHQLAVLELQQDLGQAGNARGALAVANVRFHRADGAKLVVVALSGILLIHLMESPGQSRYLDRITQGRTRAMGLQITDGARWHTRPPQGIRHQT